MLVFKGSNFIFTTNLEISREEFNRRVHEANKPVTDPHDTRVSEEYRRQNLEWMNERKRRNR